MKNNGKKKKRIFVKATSFTLVFLILCSMFAIFEMKRYDEAILEIYAAQQDAYVQLVLDQINLHKKLSDEELVEDILASLDSSTSRYWTFSDRDTILYVKDVTETNRYKGFTTESYYISDSAKQFLDRLNVNRVVHQQIDIDGHRYIASGVKYEYNDGIYKLCLLTYDHVVLDDNTLLETKIVICIVMGILLLMLLLVIMAYAWNEDKHQRRLEKDDAEITSLNLSIDGLEQQIRRNNTYDPRLNLFHEHVLGEFIGKIEEKGVKRLAVVMIRMKPGVEVQDFISGNNMYMDKKSLRFVLDDGRVLLLFLNISDDMALKQFEKMDKNQYELIGSDTIMNDYGTFEEQCRKFIDCVKFS